MELRIKRFVKWTSNSSSNPHTPFVQDHMGDTPSHAPLWKGPHYRSLKPGTDWVAAPWRPAPAPIAAALKITSSPRKECRLGSMGRIDENQWFPLGANDISTGNPLPTYQVELRAFSLTKQNKQITDDHLKFGIIQNLDNAELNTAPYRLI